MIKEMKKSKKFLNVAFAVVLVTYIFTLTGCGKTSENIPSAQSSQEDTKEQYVIIEEQNGGSKVQTALDTAQEQGEGTNRIIRAYSDKEIERMAELQQSYLDGIASPERQILEVENVESVVTGTFCYIKDTGDYCLPDRELTDEELLEIIEHGSQKKVALNGNTQEQMDAEDFAELARLRGKVQAAGGISEEEAIEIAKKALEADLGESGKDLKLHLFDSNGGGLDLTDVSDYDEYKDRGEIAYFVQFDDLYISDMRNYRSYHCVINAIDGSILGAYEIHDWDEVEFYEH